MDGRKRRISFTFNGVELYAKLLTTFQLDNFWQDNGSFFEEKTVGGILNLATLRISHILFLFNLNSVAYQWMRIKKPFSDHQLSCKFSTTLKNAFQLKQKGKEKQHS